MAKAEETAIWQTLLDLKDKGYLLDHKKGLQNLQLMVRTIHGLGHVLFPDDGTPFESSVYTNDVIYWCKCLKSGTAGWVAPCSRLQKHAEHISDALVRFEPELGAGRAEATMHLWKGELAKLRKYGGGDWMNMWDAMAVYYDEHVYHKFLEQRSKDTERQSPMRRFSTPLHDIFLTLERLIETFYVSEKVLKEIDDGYQKGCRLFERLMAQRKAEREQAKRDKERAEWEQEHARRVARDDALKNAIAAEVAAVHKYERARIKFDSEPATKYNTGLARGPGPPPFRMLEHEYVSRELAQAQATASRDDRVQASSEPAVTQTSAYKDKRTQVSTEPATMQAPAGKSEHTQESPESDTAILEDSRELRRLPSINEDQATPIGSPESFGHVLEATRQIRRLPSIDENRAAEQEQTISPRYHHRSATVPEYPVVSLWSLTRRLDYDPVEGVVQPRAGHASNPHRPHAATIPRIFTGSFSALEDQVLHHGLAGFETPQQDSGSSPADAVKVRDFAPGSENTSALPSPATLLHRREALVSRDAGFETRVISGEEVTSRRPSVSTTRPRAATFDEGSGRLDEWLASPPRNVAPGVRAEMPATGTRLRRGFDKVRERTL